MNDKQLETLLAILPIGVMAKVTHCKWCGKPCIKPIYLPHGGACCSLNHAIFYQRLLVANEIRRAKHD